MFGLYLLDVFVSQLTLNKEVYIDTGGATLFVKVVFLNFPPTEIKERKRSRNEDDNLFIYKFNNGQSIHFSMSSEELVMKMKRVPLSIGVFNVEDSFPVCYLQTHLSGCACDLGSQRIENPSSFKFRGPFELRDSGHSFAGEVDLDITISNLGRCLLTYTALAPNCFFFKTEPEGPEYKCNFKESSKKSTGMLGSYASNLANNGNQKMKGDTRSPGISIKDIAGISPVANRLAEGSPPPKPPRVPLEDPSTKRKSKKKKRKKR
ncbi:uncharacterized protein LOC100878948 [Megachile rotundata]|uniref:uncharacterized protein LOC100878948 n=1 Tax=Megachile rotundata TaxID=143995 RepID=UPI003FD15EFF